jgi:hypothetical protein
MKKLIIAIATTVSLSGFSQNLVPNGSFETYTPCPNNFSQINYATGWKQSYNNNNLTEGADYFNSCSTNPQFSTPSNVWGTQTPANGVAYIALVTMYPHNNTPSYDYRENVYIKLSTALTVGTPYLVSFQASLADNFLKSSNNLGVKFQTVPNFPIDNSAHVYTTSQITNKTGWATIQGVFIADSAYKYIAIGNFFDDANTTQMNVSGGSYNANMYYIDSVRVTKICDWTENPDYGDQGDPTHNPNKTAANLTGVIKSSEIENSFLCYPSPTKNNLNVLYNVKDTKGEFTFEIKTIEGKIIKTKSLGSAMNSELIIDLTDVPEGIYFCNLNCNGNIIKTQKIIKE